MRNDYFLRFDRRHAQAARSLEEPIVIPKEEIDAAGSKGRPIYQRPPMAGAARCSCIRATMKSQRPCYARHRSGSRRAQARRTHGALSPEFDAGEFRHSGQRHIGGRGAALGRESARCLEYAFDAVPYWHQNNGTGLFVRLTYSNAPLLDMMNVHYVEENPPPVQAIAHEDAVSDGRQEAPRQSSLRHVQAERRRRLADALRRF